jgi:hypothetical protein
LFKGPLVKAIMEGRKTVTRRVIPFTDPDRPRLLHMDAVHGVAIFGDSIPDDPNQLDMRCMHGAEDDLLYVREAFRYARINGQSGGAAEFFTIQYLADFAVMPYREDWREFYRDEIARGGCHEASATGNLYGRARPSIHMPRRFSRIDLEIVDVQAERLQEITQEEVEAEGVGPVGVKTWPWRSKWMELWDEINGDRADGAYAWAKNPWVWRIEFRRIT